MAPVALYGDRFRHPGSFGALAIGMVHAYEVRCRNKHSRINLYCAKVEGHFLVSFAHINCAKEEGG